MTSVLKKKAVKGVAWNLLEKISLQVIKFVLAVILARLLTPKDYGLIGMISVFFAVAMVFVQSGFGKAYVQKKEVTDADADTVFYTNLVISVFLYGILWLSAPAIAQFYNQPELIKLTRVMGIVVIINAFNIIQIAQLTRNVDFKRRAKVTLTSTIIGGISGIIAAFYGLGVWSLVIQQMTIRFFTTLGLWLTSRWKPSWRFSKQSFKNMFSFGAWILGANIIKTIFDNIYILTIGKFFPAAQLGFYTKSKHFQQLASEQLSQSVGSVAFPVFSQLQHNISKLQNGMCKFLQHTMFLIVPILITLIVVAKPLIILLLTHKWAPMIPYLQLLCIVGILYPIHLVNVQVLNAQGKSNLNFRLSFIKNSLRVLNIIIMYRWGVLYIILGEVIVSLLALLINTYYTHKLINYGFLKQMNDIKEIVFGGLIAGFFGFLLCYNLDKLWYNLFIGGITTITLFVVLQYIYNKPFLLEAINLKDNFIK